MKLLVAEASFGLNFQSVCYDCYAVDFDTVDFYADRVQR